MLEERGKRKEGRHRQRKGMRRVREVVRGRRKEMRNGWDGEECGKGKTTKGGGERGE